MNYDVACTCWLEHLDEARKRQRTNPSVFRRDNGRVSTSDKNGERRLSSVCDTRLLNAFSLFSALRGSSGFPKQELLLQKLLWNGQTTAQITGNVLLQINILPVMLIQMYLIINNILKMSFIHQSWNVRVTFFKCYSLFQNVQRTFKTNVLIIFQIAFHNVPKMIFIRHSWNFSWMQVHL